MLFIIGTVLVIASVLGGYVLSHGELLALWQPFEIVIIGGAAFGAFLIANPPKVIKSVFASAPSLFVGSKFNQVVFMDLLSLLYDLFDKARKSGVMSIEADVDDPENSEIFNRYPTIMRMLGVRDFITDYLRIVSSGNMAPHELEGLMDLEIETRLQELEKPAEAVNKVADALPGFGIVAAVLGIVITMKSLGGPPEELGGHVAAALVGTFFGILAAYGFVGPTAQALHNIAASEIKAYECVKVGILATMGGLAPQLAIEFGRKALYSGARPSFQELNDYVRSK
ncbi:flagellar motor stator protein MotA [Hahella ganghwensis]|uniref:flagellar motor stator protein MotA n=1 Tax=Hahella ganghwensis TaxID=286420 RepID=UPI00037B5F08|nr:flagellar motor stator protein MotA [Hahella ganghwensis]